MEDKSGKDRFWDGVFSSILFVAAIALVILYWILSGGVYD